MSREEYFAQASEQERAFLATYDPSKFPITVVTVDTVISQWHSDPRMPYGGLWKVLLVKRGNYPYKDQWALPGGFIDPQETSIEAARREVKEEAGLDLMMMQFSHIADDPERDPRGRAISMVYTAQAKGEPFAGDDAVEAAWFDFEEAVDQDLAFDHRKILLKVLGRSM